MKIPSSILATIFFPAVLITAPGGAAQESRPGPAASVPSAESQFQQARSALRGKGVPKDPAKAFALMKAAAEQGHAEAEAGLGYLYTEGLGTPKNATLAVVWLRKGAEKGSAKGQVNLSRAYLNGRGIAKNLPEGVTWLRRAAEQGLPEALYAMGDAYFLGKFDLPVDYQAAYPWALKAAEAGVAPAQNLLGLMAREGRFIPMDRKVAAEWFQKAAEQGELKAQANLGLLLYGEPKNSGVQAEALKWLLIADQRGESSARNALKEILPEMTPEDVANARHQAQQFLSSREAVTP